MRWCQSENFLKNFAKQSNYGKIITLIYYKKASYDY
jgi:hypothetical protein